MALAPRPVLNLYLTAGTTICIYRPRVSICIYRPPALNRIYRHWLIKIGNNRSQMLHVMLLFLHFLSNSFVTVIVDRADTKGNLSKKTD